VTKVRPAVSHQRVEPLPAPAGRSPYRLALADVLDPTQIRAIERAGGLRFHCVGDTGGLQNPVPQRRVAAAMLVELRAQAPVRFFYHLGDIVYLYGEEGNYLPQFFAPYAEYRAPIFAIPGNHDGDPAPGRSAGSLEAFARHFCAGAPTLNTAAEGRRAAMTQPNVYWTLLHDWVTIIGLYTNVSEGGAIAEDQLGWLTAELRAARPGVTLILAMHHPVYSIDSAHGSHLALGALLDRCFARAGRAPDAVFAAHAHNYQRFSRVYNGRQIPYVVAGTGGFHNLHPVASGAPKPPGSFDGLPEVTLEAYQDADFGFMTVTAGPDGARVTYNLVQHAAVQPFDAFPITPGEHGGST
jgi:3',5'-cyclic AMP phosphodiesterase CpdA